MFITPFNTTSLTVRDDSTNFLFKHLDTVMEFTVRPVASKTIQTLQTNDAINTEAS